MFATDSPAGPKPLHAEHSWLRDASVPSRRNSDALFVAVAVLLFFPSVTFGIISAEIFPWALLFSVFFLRRITNMTLLLAALLAASALYTLAFAHAQEDSDVLRSLAAYLNVISVFACFMQLSQARLALVRRVANVVFWLLIVLGLLQASGLSGSLDPIFSALVPRARGEALDIGGRGVTLLSSEPARAGIELALLYFLIRITSSRSNRFAVGDLLFPAYVALIVRSAGATVFALIVVALISVRVKRGWLLLVVPLVALAIIGVPTEDNRVLTLMSNLESASSLQDAIFFVANESGHRLIALYAFITSGVTHPLGSGVGNWMNSSIEALTSSGVDYGAFRYFQVWGDGHAIGVRAPGVLPNLMLDVGFVGTALFLFWIFTSSRRYIPRSGIAQVGLILLLIKISFFGSLGEPLPWIVFALALRFPQIGRNTNRYIEHA